MPRSQKSNNNMFCELKDLSNEATVEQFFVNRLLSELGYKDSQIKPKNTLAELSVNAGRRKMNYRPDYALKLQRHVRWVVEAKGVGESLDAFVGQCSGYCLGINQNTTSGNPATHFMLTNGVSTRVYEWDQSAPVLELAFEDFQPSSAKFKRLKELLGADTVAERVKAVAAPSSRTDTLTIARASISEINSAFAWCHRHIYRREHLNYSAAFMEFVKLIFLKLLSDRDVHAANPGLGVSGSAQVSASGVRFSKAWVESREADHSSPVDAILFKNLLDDLEEQIASGTKKRIFERGEHIKLQPETIKGVVEKLQGLDLYSIDSDLNGRLFETFLNATLRGKDLGQFFTPRSVVKLATRIASIEVTGSHIDTVLDSCCGTGGFLIEALSDMWAKVDANVSLSAQEKERLHHEIATKHIVGVDVAQDPALARIARINMFLHGDGGSSIYQLDALDKAVKVPSTDSVERRAERAEFRMRIQGEGFDVALTNPPFAKEYVRKTEPEAEILDRYELAYDTTGGKRKPLPGLKSSIMFIERYYDLLKPGGRLVTVIDDSILGGERDSRVRDFIRAKFLVRAVVSLPGDAFQRSQARVKTSIVVLEKKAADNQEQPPVFMYYCTKVGVDDVARQRVLPADEIARERAGQEIETVMDLYTAFKNGEERASAWAVQPEKLAGRLDVKACLPQVGRRVTAWEEAGLTVVTADAMLEPGFLPEEDGEEDVAVARASDLIVAADTSEEVTHLRVRYDGFAEPGDTIVASDSKYRTLYRVRENDIVISHINAVHGAVCVVPADLGGTVVTSEYTVCRAREGYDPYLLWEMLRTPEARADLLLSSSGIGRTRVHWANVRELKLPIPPDDVAAKVVEAVKLAHQREAEARQAYALARKSLSDALGTDNRESRDLLAAFKPPR